MPKWKRRVKGLIDTTSLQSLDLSQIHISGRDLATSLLEEVKVKDEDEDETSFPPSPLRVLVLNNAHVNDDACVGISTLRHLETLYLEQAKITVEGLTTIMQGCPKLRLMNLKGCRGIPVRQRRDWFDLYDRGEVGDTE